MAKRKLKKVVKNGKEMLKKVVNIPVEPASPAKKPEENQLLKIAHGENK